MQGRVNDAGYKNTCHRGRMTSRDSSVDKNCQKNIPEFEDESIKSIQIATRGRKKEERKTELNIAEERRGNISHSNMVREENVSFLLF